MAPATHKKRIDTFADTWECRDVPRLPRMPRKTILQLALTPWNRIGFAASHIDTARPQENQRLETRHVGASKRAFRARLSPILTLCSFKIDVFLRLFLRTWKFATSKSMFRVRPLSIFSTPHKRQACHGVCHKTRLKCMPRKMKMDTSTVLRLPRKLHRIFWKRRKSTLRIKRWCYKFTYQKVVVFKLLRG